MNGAFLLEETFDALIKSFLVNIGYTDTVKYM